MKKTRKEKNMVKSKMIKKGISKGKGIGEGEGGQRKGEETTVGGSNAVGPCTCGGTGSDMFRWRQKLYLSCGRTAVLCKERMEPIGRNECSLGEVVTSRDRCLGPVLATFWVTL